MNDPIQINDTSHLNPAMHAGGMADHDGQTNFRELFDILWSGKWVVAAITAIATGLSIGYALIAEPVYQANGLIQVEHDQQGLDASVDELASLIGNSPGKAPAEIAILRSRMVLSAVVNNLKLDIDAEPVYFPVIGSAIARRYNNAGKPRPAMLGLDGFAWGGERIKVTAFDVPQAYLDKSFILRVGASGFRLSDSDGRISMEGRVGERISQNTPIGPITIFVQELVARPNTRFQVRRLALPTILDQVGSGLSVVEQPRDSGVLSIKVLAPQPEMASLLVNEIQDAYLRQNVERRSAQAEQSLEFLKRQLPVLRENVDSAQARLNAYQLQRGTVDVQQETSLVLKRTVDLETQVLTLVQERDAALQRFTAQHPVVATLGEQIRGLEREKASIRRQVESLPQTQQEILSLMRDLEVNTQLYTALLNSSQELQVTKAGTIGNVRTIDRGLAPLSPLKPRKKIIAAIGFLLGNILGIVAVFALRTLLRGVDRPEEVERTLGLPTYASIPYSRAQRGVMLRVRQGKHTESLVLAGLESNDLAVEALRSLRTSLHFAMMEAPNNIVMFTGPVAALGKSFVSINLGALLAMSGKRVLVIDADLRRGRLHQYVGVKQKPGLSDFVAGTAESAQAVTHSTSIVGLDFMPGGTRPPNPSEILMSERFTETLKQLSLKYDYVLIDTPPVLPVTDAAIIGRMAGTTLLVLKSAEHPMRAIEETIKRLRQAGVQVRGTIFNQVGARVGSYGYGSYGYAYGYSSYGYKDKK